MKKKILFILPSFEIGGTVVSTKNLILLLDERKYDITVLCLNGIGSMSYLYHNIKQIKPSLTLTSITRPSYKDQDNIFSIIYAGLVRKLCHFNYIRNFILDKEAKRINPNKYDIIAACQEGFCTDFVSRTTVRKKIAWVRCDYSRYLQITNKSEKDIYDKYSYIICVSELVSKKFIQIYPDFIHKVYDINNPQSSVFIKNQANKKENDIKFINDKFTIVSVGRFDPIKRFNFIPEIASSLVKNNIDFRWYIIGDGNEKQKLIDSIKEKDVVDYVIPLGKKNNPHYYIKQSSLLVVLSSSEACPRVINEAKILHIPVISTDFETAKEYINNEYDGIICSIDDIANNIIEMIQNKHKYNTIKSNLSCFRFNNDTIMKKIDKLLE